MRKKDGMWSSKGYIMDASPGLTTPKVWHVIVREHVENIPVFDDARKVGHAVVRGHVENTPGFDRWIGTDTDLASTRKVGACCCKNYYTTAVECARILIRIR